jgi:hypothetical protein
VAAQTPQRNSLDLSPLASTGHAAGGAFDHVDARKHGSGLVEKRVSYPSTMNRWDSEPPSSRRKNYVAAAIQLVLAVVVAVAPFVTNVATPWRVLGVLTGAVLVWFGAVLIRQGRAAA